MDEVRQSSARLGYQLAVCPALNVTFKAVLTMTLVDVKKIVGRCKKFWENYGRDSFSHRFRPDGDLPPRIGDDDVEVFLVTREPVSLDNCRAGYGSAGDGRPASPTATQLRSFRAGHTPTRVSWPRRRLSPRRPTTRSGTTSSPNNPSRKQDRNTVRQGRVTRRDPASFQLCCGIVSPRCSNRAAMLGSRPRKAR